MPVQPNNILLETIFFGLSSSVFCFSDSPLDNSKEISFKALKPSGPVSAFAFLVLTKSAYILFDLIFLFHFKFSDIIFDWVKTEAWVAPSLK